MNRAERIKKDNCALIKKAKRFYTWNRKYYSWPEFLELAWVRRLIKTHSWHRPDLSGLIDHKQKLHKEKVDAQKQLKEELNY
jgi:hypothetical protein